MMLLEDKVVLNQARDIARKGGCFVQVKQLGLVHYEFKVWCKVSSRFVFVGKRSNVNTLLQLVKNAVKTKGTS